MHVFHERLGGEFDDNGLMSRRDASINDYKIEEHERRIDIDH